MGFLGLGFWGLEDTKERDGRRVVAATPTAAAAAAVAMPMGFKGVRCSFANFELQSIVCCTFNGLASWWLADVHGWFITMGPT